MSALRKAGTRVFEPVHRISLEIPAETYGAVLPVLAQLRAVPHPPTVHGPSYLLEAMIPAARVHELQQRLPTLTSGEGVLESTFDHYQAVRGSVLGPDALTLRPRQLILSMCGLGSQPVNTASPRRTYCTPSALRCEGSAWTRT